jgi:hypothetical protein
VEVVIFRSRPATMSEGGAEAANASGQLSEDMDSEGKEQDTASSTAQAEVSVPSVYATLFSG